MMGAIDDLDPVGYNNDIFFKGRETMALYLMLSRTNTGMGKVIRTFTRGRYNHVSLTLDPELRSFVSFARYVRGVPLAGGFVQEPAERFLCEEGPLPVRVFSVELEPQRERALSGLFGQAGDPDTGLIYDTLGALLTTWKIRTHIQGAYTCLGFASAVLGQSFRSLQELEAFLEPYEVFCGDLRSLVTDSGDRTAPFFGHRGFWQGTGDTTVHFARLLGRILGVGKTIDPVQALCGE